MNRLKDEAKKYADEGLADFYQRKMKLLQGLTFHELLGAGFCLFKPVRPSLAGDIVEVLLDAFVCSSGEQLFESFLKDLSLFVVRKKYGGHKATMSGVDLEFEKEGIYYTVLVKSGLYWGNSSQQKKLAQDLRDAVIRVKQSRTSLSVQPVLGICYGKTRTSHTKAGYLKVVGQNFWYLISENEDLYTDIIEPIGFRAKEHNETFVAERGKLINRFTRQFIERFCDSSGAIDWVKLVEFNSSNYDLYKFLPETPVS